MPIHSIPFLLVWGSLIAVTLKRFICCSIEQFYTLYNVHIDGFKDNRLLLVFSAESIIKKQRKQLTDVLERMYFFLKENTARAHPKREKLKGLYQFGVEPYFEFQS